MRARPRDFIYTKDDLFFATTSYLHPEDRILAFLRYIPDDEGERSINGQKYSKVDSEQAYNFLKENYPHYLYECDNTRVEMMGVPLNKIKTILKPNERLKELKKENSEDPLLQKVILVADTFHEEASIPYDSMGISGSILPGLYDPKNSDIDFVVYGLSNHRLAMQTFAKLKDNNKNGNFFSIDDEYWEKVYNKRIKDSTLSLDEFCWYEKRKNNRGIVKGTLFDILATKEWNEIKGVWGDTRYEPMGFITVECTVSNALAAFDNPATYEVEDIKIIDGPHVEIKEIASFTHTYSGQALEGEKIISRGKLEKVIGSQETYRVVVGTTRESLNEFIKLKKSPTTPL
ncbi:DNA polymerase subunit beta [Methanobacterium alcaliphilum]|uniref:DNA polymerase subunit beta n=1 Tax=Methanobacterium alcaliphilum TaxID=392018 RepID=UPI0024A95849|nr:DNA polymerase subunit beta [Methanobacterium alcaliphilum]